MCQSSSFIKLNFLNIILTVSVPQACWKSRGFLLPIRLLLLLKLGPFVAGREPRKVPSMSGCRSFDFAYRHSCSIWNSQALPARH